ncbi:MAG: hypothetical protein LJE67_01250 [Salaquimonas sp.]|jgi:hypothetical protein|nr:hypothetical protein [Salaquimonas sp.]
MLRAIFRAISLVCLAIALVAGVLDITRSIADSHLVLTPLYADWSRFSQDSLVGLKTVIEQNLFPFVWDPVFATILKSPTWSIFGILSILFAVAARRRRRPWQENFLA